MKLADVVVTPSKTIKSAAQVHFFTGDGFTGDGIFKQIEQQIKRLGIKPDAKGVYGFDEAHGDGRIYIVGLGKKEDVTMRVLKDACADAVRRLKADKCTDAAYHMPRIFAEKPAEAGEAMATGIHLGNYSFLTYKSKKTRDELIQLSKCALVAGVYAREQLAAVEQGVERAGIVSEAVYRARDLVNDPANNARPADLEAAAKDISAASHGTISVKILDKKQCKTLGMGAYLGVAQGSDEDPAFIVLHYRPADKPRCSVALIGKSITFDSGGLSLKPSEAMMDMKIDMAGGATVLGVFSALARLRTPAEVWGVLPACENMPSGKAQKPGDIVTAMNGKSIEVLNTDAEGRLTLADALAYVEQKIKPDYIIDLATLTGANMVALGTDIAGLFGRDETFTKQFHDAATSAGDDSWTLPLYTPYAKLMVSDLADLKNIGGGRYGGAITAALFLAEFVESKKWIHVDMAGPSHRSAEARGALPKGATGWGVQTLLSLLDTIN